MENHLQRVYSKLGITGAASSGAALRSMPRRRPAAAGPGDTPRLRLVSRLRPALLTDHYELTMVSAALRDGTADRRCVFEVFTRRLPTGRRYGVVAGTGRLIE